MEELIQRSILLKKHLIFQEDGIEIISKDSNGESSVFIDFERIQKRGKLRLHTKRKPYILKVGLLIAFITFSRGLLTTNTNLKITLTVIAVSLVIAGITFLLHKISTLKFYYIDLEENKAFFILADKPNKATVAEFIDEIFRRRTLYYRENFFYINYENNKKDEASKMQWLRNEGIITENEFNVVIDEINESIEN